MKLHCCLFDHDCRIAGLIWRIYLTTSKGNLGVALLPRSKFAGRDPSRWTSRERRRR